MYEQKYWWKRGLFLVAVCIGLFSLWYTERLVDVLAKEEEKKVLLWADATRHLVSAGENTDFDFLLNIIKDNETIPVILVDDQGAIIDFRNLDSSKAKNPQYLSEQLEQMKALRQPIPILYDEINRKYNYLYYKNSIILTQLQRYPIYQLSIIAVFILVSYFAFSASRRAEQNRVWVGMSKETAHQLGTPISSINAWLDIIRETPKEEQESVLNELQRDIKRLETITERFSKIGSTPVLEPVLLKPVLEQCVSYIKKRTSSKVSFKITSEDETIQAPVNVPLLEWVIENICKNAVDAMEGNGSIHLHLSLQNERVCLDISDTGKGIPKSKLKTVFKPGYTTKKRGWGLGLSLVKRIIETYHQGRVFVKESDPEKGTTFRILFSRL